MMKATALKSILRNELNRWVSALENRFPLFVLLCLYMTLPGCYEQPCTPVNILATLVVALPQSIGFSLIFVRLASVRKWLYRIVLVISSILFFGETVAFFAQSSRITTTIMHFVLQTNPREVTEFLQDGKTVKALSCATATLLIILLLYWQTCRHWNKRCISNISYRYKSIAIVVLIIFAFTDFGYINHITDNEIARRQHLYKCSTPLVYHFIWKDVLGDTRINNLDKVERAIDELTITQSCDTLNVIYVIGESHSKNRCSIYGYPKPTTPRIEEMVRDSSVIALTDVISHHCFTSYTYPELLSMHCIDDSAAWYDYPLLPAVFKKAGFYVGYFSNQSLIDSKKFDFTHQFFFSRPGLRQKSYDEKNDSLYNYDLDFVNNVHPRLLSSKNFILYHLMGQHSQYAERFPTEQAFFTPDDYTDLKQLSPRQREIMADFDNAIRYNDLVLDSIISHYSSSNSILFYVPDHSEECYDYRDSYGRFVDDYSIGAIKFACEVPVYIWMSDKYRQRYPEQVLRLRRAAKHRLYNSDIVHTIVDVAGISSPKLDLRYSLLHDSIAHTPRMIYNTVNYDAMKDSIDEVVTYY